MKEKLIKNPGLKLISIALAFVIWFAAVNVSNPEVSRTKSVSLVIVNEDILTSAGKSFSIPDSRNVTVNYEVRTRDEYKIKASDFKVTADLADLYDVTGSVPVSVEVVNNKDLIIGTPYARPGVIQVTTEDIQTKKFQLSTNTKGKPEEGYSVGSINADPQSVNVSGPVSMIGRISSIGIEVNVDGAKADLTGETKPVFYDANGNKVDIRDDAVKLDPDTISYTVKMLRGKSLSLNFNVTGNVAEGYRYIGAECNVKSVAVVGQKSTLDGISAVNIPEGVLNIQGATSDVQVKLNVADYLPEGVSVNGDSEITVTLKVGELNRKSFTLSLSDINQVGHTAGYSYSLDPSSIQVEVSGLAEDLDLLKASDLKAEVDFTHLSLGSHDGSLTFNPPKGYTVKTYTPFKIVVYDSQGSKPASDSGPGVSQPANESTVETKSETVSAAPSGAGEPGKASGPAETTKSVTEASKDAPGTKDTVSASSKDGTGN